MTVRSAITLFVGIAVMTTPVPSSARVEPPPSIDDADEPAPLGPDEVVLTNGGFLRGTLVEVLPDEHVVLVLGGSHERRRIPHAEIERIERGKHAPPREAEATAPPQASEPDPQPDPQPETEPPPQRGKPRVHIDTANDRSVNLFEIGTEQQRGGPYGTTYGASFTAVCAAPCDREVDGTSGKSFFLGQDIWTASPRFKLDEYSGDLTIRVRPGNKTLRIVGAVLLGVGIGAAVAGGVFVFGENTRRTGVGLLASGAAGIVIGTPMLVFGRTRFEMVRPQK